RHAAGSETGHVQLADVPLPPHQRDRVVGVGGRDERERAVAHGREEGRVAALGVQQLDWRMTGEISPEGSLGKQRVERNSAHARRKFDNISIQPSSRYAGNGIKWHSILGARGTLAEEKCYSLQRR